MRAGGRKSIPAGARVPRRKFASTAASAQDGSGEAALPAQPQHTPASRCAPDKLAGSSQPPPTSTGSSAQLTVAAGHAANERSPGYDSSGCPDGGPAGVPPGSSSPTGDAARQVQCGPLHTRSNHVPATAPYSLAETLADLLHMAARLLKLGGRLVFFIPSPPGSEPAFVPSHPALQLVANSEQARAGSQADM